MTTIHTFVDFVRYLDKKCKSENILFRGQEQDWPLLPKLARPDLRLKKAILEAEQILFRDFRTNCRQLLEVGTDNPWELLVIAQHHGLPTRLLDWTKNPLAALWFAVKEPAKEEDSNSIMKLSPGVIWVNEFEEEHCIGDIANSSPFQIEMTKILRPTCVARRISSQFGWFTVHAHYGKDRGFMAYDKGMFSGGLTKLIIPPESFCDIRYHLDRCGVNAASLFPDLDGLCKYLQWLHTLLKDENPEGCNVIEGAELSQTSGSDLTPAT